MQLIGYIKKTQFSQKIKTTIMKKTKGAGDRENYYERFRESEFYYSTPNASKSAISFFLPTGFLFSMN